MLFTHSREGYRGYPQNPKREIDLLSDKSLLYLERGKTYLRN